MAIKLRKHLRRQAFLLPLTLIISQIIFLQAHAEVILMPIQRVVPTQPVTKLEVISMIRSILNGRVLSIEKQSTDINPDCHHIKFLEDYGEFHMIQVGCSIDNVVQSP